MIKLITIDFWNTLFDSGNGIKRNNYRFEALRHEIFKHNLELDEAKFIEATKSSWQYFNNIWLNESRTPAPKDTITFLLNYLNLKLDNSTIDLISKEFGESILYYPPKLMDGAREALETFSRDFKLAIISDTGFSPGTILRQLLVDIKVYDYFSAFSFSDETCVSKPDPKAYKTILNALKIEPGDAIHIGDIEKTDIAGALGVGMKSIRFLGDKTADNFLHNPSETKADFSADSWDEIKNIIYTKFL